MDQKHNIFFSLLPQNCYRLLLFSVVHKQQNKHFTEWLGVEMTDWLINHFFQLFFLHIFAVHIFPYSFLLLVKKGWKLVTAKKETLKILFKDNLYESYFYALFLFLYFFQPQEEFLNWWLWIELVMEIWVDVICGFF